VDADSLDGVLDERSSILDERAGIYVTSIPGCNKWFNSSESTESLSRNDAAVLKGDKDRVVAAGQHEIGIVVKCYNGLEKTLSVCSLVEIIGILEMPDEHLEEEGETTQVIIHAITAKQKQFNEIILGKYGQLSPGFLHFTQD
jgi:hypothetical protein